MCFVVQHAVGFVSGDKYFGAKASINVWAPRVTNQYEFSLSQIWVISGSFGQDLNTIEAGWQVGNMFSSTHLILSNTNTLIFPLYHKLFINAYTKVSI